MTATLSAGVTTGLERSFGDVLGDVLGTGAVPVDAHFFDDLGADSMVMARFCAQARKRDDLPSVSIKDVYRHTTIGEGSIGVAPFAELLAHPSMSCVPVVVETPSELDGSPSAGHARDIALLRSLRDGLAVEPAAA